LLRIQLLHLSMLDLRTRAALAAASTLTPSSHRDALLGSVARDARGLERGGSSWARGLGALRRAGARAPRGRDQAARGELLSAVALLEAADSGLHAAVARRRAGELEGGTTGQALIGAADAWMAARGIVRAERIAALIAPGFATRP